jgi:hypothetical protein
VVAGGAHSGNFLAFAGGWFKSQLGYLKLIEFIIKNGIFR